MTLPPMPPNAECLVHLLLAKSFPSFPFIRPTILKLAARTEGGGENEAQPFDVRSKWREKSEKYVIERNGQPARPPLPRLLSQLYLSKF